jgi:hypothetical protein
MNIDAKIVHDDNLYGISGSDLHSLFPILTMSSKNSGFYSLKHLFRG